MAIDEKLLVDLSPGDSAVDRLRKRNRRIRPWESSRIDGGGGESPSGQDTPTVVSHGSSSTLSAYSEEASDPKGISPLGSDDQRARHPEGDSPPSEPALTLTGGGESPRGQDVLRVSHLDGALPRGIETLRVKHPHGRNTQRGRGQKNRRIDTPGGKTPVGGSITISPTHEHVLSVDTEGGFDPRPFLPQGQREMKWREKGHGEFRIPHRLHEFVQRVTATRNELLTLNCLMRFSLGFHRPWCEAGYSFISAWTGISDLGNVRKSVRSLIASGIIRKTQEHNCASNLGSIYEIPVVEAYLSYAKAAKSTTDEGQNGGHGDSGNECDDPPGGDSPSGSAVPRVNRPQASGQDALTPTGETPPKKENINQNLKKTLSQEISPELSLYLEQVRPMAKRESEYFFLKKLLEEYSMNDIQSSLRYVLKFGVLGGGGNNAHSPLRYLSTSIEQVRIKALKEEELIKTIDVTRNHDAQEEQTRAETLREFEKHLSPSEQENYLAEVTRDNSVAGFTPPMIVLRKLAAMKWSQCRIRVTA